MFAHGRGNEVAITNHRIMLVSPNNLAIMSWGEFGFCNSGFFVSFPPLHSKLLTQIKTPGRRYMDMETSSNNNYSFDANKINPSTPKIRNIAC